ncbi:helix-turn-helix domain-containing protein [Geoalkalibacter subterraneus]|uniref:helix-turn-helix domain-containing protein n=1 Tax=Geoalkalibacter subterraneus TaxID=483547 RepID=UPI00338D5DE7
MANTIEHAVVFCQGSKILPGHLPESVGNAADQNFNLTLKNSSLAAAEAALIREVLEQKGWHLSHAAEALGIARGTLYSKMEKLGIRKPA